MLGRVLFRADEWKAVRANLQKVTVTLILTEPASTGFHKIYVFADPEPLDDNHTDGIIGKLDEPRSFDNNRFRSLIVNEVTLNGEARLSAPRNTNRGDGSADVRLNIGEAKPNPFDGREENQSILSSKFLANML